MFYSYKHLGETRLTDALERELLLEAEQSYSEMPHVALRASVKAAAATLRRWLTSGSTTASSYWVSFHKHAA